MNRQAITLLELLIVVSILAVLVALLLPAIQAARASVFTIQCQNNLKQIGLACQGYHTVNLTLPSGHTIRLVGAAVSRTTWLVRLLPHLEQESLWHQTQQAYRANPVSTANPPHLGLATVLPVFACPADPSTLDLQVTRNDRRAALTNYIGVLGTNYLLSDGCLFFNSRIRLSEITDGTSHTLLIGERPPSADFWYGWWYSGIGQSDTGSPNHLLGLRELNDSVPYLETCSIGPFSFRDGAMEQPCDVLHFWSRHRGGAHFALADGSVRFFSYAGAAHLTALATRAGGEVASLYD